MTSEKLIKYWIETSDDDFEAVIALFNSKQYSHSLFFGHLVIERLLKALFAKLNPREPNAPWTHNLPLLANYCGLELNAERANSLETISRFNIKARYEDYKREFYKQCSREYTNEWIAKIKELREWLKKLIAE